ncbi:MAG: hypothetical protein HUJ72_10215 [Blautia sp.]|nr:hypothetical protein [Blautia sp.]
MKDYKITFWNPGFAPEGDDVFGCASLGFVDGNTWVEPTEDRLVKWKTVPGAAYSGTYEETLKECKASPVKPNTVFVFFASDEGNDGFVDSLQDMYPGVPVLGGTAAKNPEQERGEIRPYGRNCAVLLTEEAFETDRLRVHNHDLKMVSCQVEGSRIIRTIEGIPAEKYLADRRKELGKPLTDFESLTFHESCGKNVHCCTYPHASLYAGANLYEHELMLAEIDRSQVDDVISGYMSRENTFSIGCAGLKSLLTKPFGGAENNVGVFLFGEVMPFEDGRSRFANLMLARVK